MTSEDEGATSPAPQAPRNRRPGAGARKAGGGGGIRIKALEAAERELDADSGAGIAPPVAPARLRRRHKSMLWTFLLVVVLPFALVAGYMTTYAQDQYASEAGFSVRKEEGPATVDAIGGLAQLTGAASTDAEILYNYIQSQDLVALLDAEFDLDTIYARNHDADPFMTLKPGAPIEDKVKYWQRQITIEYNEGSGLIRLEVRAFTPEDAKMIADAVMRHSTAMINRLSDTARQDATRYAVADLERAVERLKEVRERITEYRSRTQLVDPLTDIQGQMGLLSNLEAQLAESLIELDMLADIRDGDPRKDLIERRIEVINKRIAEERSKFSVGGPSSGASGDDYATIVAEYERLIVDRQVAEEAFRSSTMLLEAARAEAQRQSRYLAAHIPPTLAQSPQYPRVALILTLTGFFLTLLWTMGLLVYYSIKDRR